MATLTPRPPRRSLSEAAFRRFEAHIAQACSGSFTLDPSATSPPLRPNSYVSAARDALRGYELHGYPSTLIPSAYDTGRIKVREWEDGLVKWENLYEDRQARVRGREPAKPKPPEDHASVLIQHGQVVAVRQKEQPLVTLHVKSESSLPYLHDMTKGLLNGFTTLVLVHPTMAGVKDQFRGLAWEELAEGWWRVT